MSKTLLFQTIQSSISTQFQCQKIVLFHTILFSISTQFSSIWLIDRTLSDAITLSQSGHRGNGNKGELCISQSSSITEASPSHCLMSYPEHSLGKSYHSAEIQFVYSTGQADWAMDVVLRTGQEQWPIAMDGELQSRESVLSACFVDEEISSSSSCHAASSDIPDPLSPLLLIIHRLWQVFRATSCILTELLYVCSSWSSCFCLAICGGP